MRRPDPHLARGSGAGRSTDEPFRLDGPSHAVRPARATFPPVEARRDRTAIRGLSGMWMPLAAFFLGEVLAGAGRHEEAIRSFRAFRRWPEWDNNPQQIGHAYPLSLYREAVSLERLGRGAESMATVDRLLALWKGADADLPALVEARALRSRLASRR